MPGLVRQMLFLTGREVDVGALGEGVGLELSGFGRVAMYSHVLERAAGERLDAGFERGRQAGAVGRAARCGG